MKNMEWDERVWLATKDAVSGIPPFVRGRALRKIISKAEEIAMERNALKVESQDVWNAVELAVPEMAKPMCRDALKEAGL